MRRHCRTLNTQSMRAKEFSTSIHFIVQSIWLEIDVRIQSPRPNYFRLSTKTCCLHIVTDTYIANDLLFSFFFIYFRMKIIAGGILAAFTH